MEMFTTTNTKNVLYKNNNKIMPKDSDILIFLSGLF